MALDDPLIGKKLGDYTIQDLLGRGGMSRVYQGYDENLDRYAAVKVISGDFATTSEEEYTRRFQTEARAIARLRHENIVGVYQFGRTEGIYYMAQVFLEGKDLRTLLKEYAERHERIPREEVLHVVRDITSALDYAHEQGVIHRDIKPSNIMLEKRTGRAILMDFGLALSVHEGTMGDTFGSAHYIAPEQAISSAKAVPQSDLYSLGIVIYEMLAGKVPFDDPSVMSVALKHLNEMPPPPTLYNPDLSPSVEAVIMRVLDKDPNRRHATGRQLYLALQDAFDRDQLTDSPEQISITDMLASRPTPPGDVQAAAQQQESRETPRPTGIAGRFAQRHEERKAEVEIEADSGALGIDDATLNSILEGYDDPGKIGLTGKDAAPRRPSTPPEAEAEQPRKKRRSRVGLLLFLLLLVVIGFGAAWFGLGLGDSDDDAGTTGSATLEATAIAAADQTATADEQDSQTVTASAEAEVSATPTGAPTRTPTASATTSTTAEPTESVPVVDSGTAAPTASRTARATNTEEPTATHTATTTPAPTDTPEPSETAEATATAQPLATATDSTATEPAATAATPDLTSGSTATGPAHEPNLRLIYSEESNNQGQLLLVNLTTQTLDVSTLVFEHERRDGMILRYEARWWDRSGISATPDAMPGRSCFQLVTTNGTARTFGGRDCPYFLGFYRTNIPDRYFWIADEPGASFSVYDTGSETPDEPLAICAVEAGRCDFYMGPDAETVIVLPPTATLTLTPSNETPTATATPLTGRGPELRLLYNDNSFLLINNSSRRVDVSNLVFEQRMGDGAIRRFEADQWDRSGIIAPPSSMEPRGCYQLVTVDGVQDSPEDTDCLRLLGWFRTGVTSRYFWLADDEDAEFVVREEGSEDVIATCPIAAGECVFSLPLALPATR